MALNFTKLLSSGDIGMSLDGGTVCVVNAGGNAEKISGVQRRVEKEEPPNPKALTDAIQSAIKAADAVNKRLHVSLSSRDSIIRCFFMPWIPSKERKTAVRFQAQKYMPFALESLCYDYEIFEDKSASRLTVVFMASRREIVTAFVSELANAGAALESLEPASLSLARSAFHQTTTRPLEAHAIVAVGEASVNIVIVKNKTLFSSQEIRLSAEVLGGDLSAAVAELAHAFDFFLKSFKGEEVKRILVVVGAGQDLEKWKTALAAEFGLGVESLRPPKPVAGLTYTPDTATATGLALKRSGAGASKINLLSKEATLHENLKKTSSAPLDQKTLKRWIVAAAGVVVALTLIGLVVLMFLSSAESEAIQEVVRTRPALTSVALSSPIEEIQKTEALLLKKQKALRVFIEERAAITVKWSEIARLTPPNIVLTSVETREFTDNDDVVRRYLSIEGGVYDNESGAQIVAVNSFLTALKQSAPFMQGIVGGKMTQANRLDRGIRGMRFQLVFSEAENIESNNRV